MQCDDVIFSLHALRKMFERGLTTAEVAEVVRHGETIAMYPDDRPYPSRLLLGRAGPRAVHVVVAYNEPAKSCIVVTAYTPDRDRWDSDFKRRL